MRPGERARRGYRGFTYLGLLVLVVLIGLFLSAAGQVTATASQRDREEQLLWAGHEYRAAIGRYLRQRRAYPMALSDLLGSAPDAPLQVRYLRSLYPDPMAKGADWVIIAAPNGGVMGVASSSLRAPIKTGHFDEADAEFAGATTYADWKFVFVTPKPGAKPPDRPAPGPR
jgi:type II secretory pathway pseudopilin PulG